MSKAFVTLVTNDLYVPGALALATSLRLSKTPFPLICVLTAHVTEARRQQLASIFDRLEEVDLLDSGDEIRLALLGRPELGVTITKLQVFGLTEYSRLAFLDADTIVLQNIDDIFDQGRASFAAASDVGWPDCFNSGVFVFTPEEKVKNELVKLALESGSFDGGDQGVLNQYFKDWSTTANARLPFLYNVVSTAFYSYKPAFERFKSEIKVYHFIGSNKPWFNRFDPPAVQDFEMRQLWWKYYDVFVYSGAETIKKADLTTSAQLLEPEFAGLKLSESASSSQSSRGIAEQGYSSVPDYMKGSGNVHPSATRKEHLTKFINYRVGWSDAQFTPQEVPADRLVVTLQYVHQELEELNKRFEELNAQGGSPAEIEEIGKRIDGLNKARDSLAQRK